VVAGTTTPMSPWQRLSRELDQWHALGREATLWWRDDDAITATPALDRLVELQCERGVPLALAVIPAHAHEALAHALERHSRIAVLQHGYAHDNHAARGERSIELTGHRRRACVVEELQRGWRKLQALFRGRLLPVMVPPWNRISPELLPELHALGFRALSCFAARPRREAFAGLLQTNCHADLIDWRRGRRFRGEERIIEQICAHLEARRNARVDAREASGILSHHLVHDDACWRFLDTLFEHCCRHPAARWLEADEACLVQ
jgi:hypothetical protein